MFLLAGTHATAKWYVGGHVDFVKPKDPKDVEGVGNANGISLSDLDLENALGYGAKVGYCFPGYMDCLGLVFEVFTANPHIK